MKARCLALVPVFSALLTGNGPAQASEAPPGATIRLTRTQPESEAALARGYAHLQAGRLEAARRDYEIAGRTNPRNVDILVGLAAIAQRQGHLAEALRHARQAVTADPLHMDAQAALLGLIAAANPAAAESRLKGLLADQLASAPLSFCLGNLYARQARWAEARQAFASASAADGDNPDYLFNLAVSLDHLRLPELATRHYRQALAAAERRPATFDPERARRRILDLQP